MISLNPMLFKNIAHVWFFKHFAQCTCWVLSLSLSQNLTNLKKWVCGYVIDHDKHELLTELTKVNIAL